jgi:hypothetical protein
MRNEIENIFNDKFDNYTSAPRADLFDNILAKRAKKKRAIWLWGAAAILLGSTLVAFWITSPTSETVKHNSVKNPQQEQTSTTEDINVVQDNQLSDPIILQPALKKVSSDAIPQNTLTTSKSHNKKLNVEKAATYKIKTSTPSKVANKELADLYAKLVADAKNNDPKKGRLITKNGEQSIDKDKRLVFDKINEIETPKTTNFEAPNELPNQNEPEAPSVIADGEKNIPKSKLNKYSGWVIEASAGPGYGNRILDGNANFITLRNKTDEAKLSYNATLQASYQFAAKWSVVTGVYWTKRNELFTYESPGSVTINERNETRYETVIHPVLGTIIRAYTVSVMDTTYTSASLVNSNNTYSSISIPIQLERVLCSNNKWSLLAKGGLLTSISNKATGKTLASDENVLILNSSTMKKIGVHSMLLGIGATYNLTDRVQLVGYPQARWALNSSVNNVGFKQREIGLDTHLGFRIRL